MNRLRCIISKIRDKTLHTARLMMGCAPKVNLFYWSPDGAVENFGDYMSLVIVREILSRNGHSIKDPIPPYKIWKATSRLLAVGSILHFAQDGDTVWGSGINGKIRNKEHTFDSLDVRMVRGPLTRNYLNDNFGIKSPRIYGDPALLVSRLLEYDLQFKRIDAPDYIFIPNLNDIEIFDDRNMISPLEDWRQICNLITQTDLVISTSLHGIIVAEAFGTPARLVQSRAEPMFKYRDYYLGTDRTQVQAANTIQEALNMGGRSIPSFNEQAMLESFPLDLWD